MKRKVTWNKVLLSRLQYSFAKKKPGTILPLNYKLQSLGTGTGRCNFASDANPGRTRITGIPDTASGIRITIRIRGVKTTGFRIRNTGLGSVKLNKIKQLAPTKAYF
jgi:hypothetical protein